MLMSMIPVDKLDFDDLTPDEKEKATGNLIEKMHETVMMFAEALVEYGRHDDDCPKETKDSCSCNFSTISNMAKHMIELDDHLNGKSTVN
jgi:hypothetical protein